MANRRTTVRFPVFNGFSIIVILSQNAPLTSSRLRVRRMEGDDMDEHEAAAFIYDDDNPARCWLVFSVNDIDEGLVAHECLHAVQHMLRYVRVRVDDEELNAYHQGYLVNQIHKLLKR